MKTALLPLALAALLGGCAQISQVTGGDSAPQVISAQTAQRLDKREWELKGLSLDGRSVVIDVETKITILFTADGKVGGNAAVNRYNGSYSFGPGGRLSWGKGEFALTRRAGPPELMEKEQAYMRALPRTNAAILAGRTLVIQSEDGSTVLTFVEVGY